jgi:AraC-like DNA-binding protein
MSLPPAKAIDIRDDWIKEHLRYEIGMLTQTHKLLDWTDTALPEGIILNALIESFCVHARTLIELFRDETEATMTGNGKLRFEALTSGFIHQGRYDDYDKLLNNQISHLGNLRERDPAKKIDRKVRVTLTNLLRQDLVTFKQCLKTQWQSPALPDIEDFSANPPAYLNVSPLPPSASSISFGTTVQITHIRGQTTNADVLSISIIQR